jgi:hypothetical protein
VLLLTGFGLESWRDMVPFRKKERKEERGRKKKLLQ